MSNCPEGTEPVEVICGAPTKHPDKETAPPIHVCNRAKVFCLPPDAPRPDWNCHDHGSLSDALQGEAYIEDGKHEGPTVYFYEVADEDAEHEVAAKPDTLEVCLGEWLNLENASQRFAHFFSYTQFNAFDTGRYPSGQIKALEFGQKGTVRIYSEIDRHIAVKVHVKDCT